MVSNALGLYLHIPFCQAICSYCHFNRGLLDEPLKRRYVDAIAREIGGAGDGSRVDTMFFGGGTPSLLAPEDVARLIGACLAAYDVAPDAEITLEANPETIAAERVAAFLDAGVNRLSVGVQSFDGGELARLGRVHSADRAADAIRAAQRAGCRNVSLDLMLALPGQSAASWRRTIDRAIALEPAHVSLYLLELYATAPLERTMARAKTAGVRDWIPVTDDEAAEMYLDGLDRLDAAGYEQYEISNVARPGHQSRHNLKYWRSGAWRGFGCGAHSTVGRHRWHNVGSTTEYVERIGAKRAVALDVQERGDRDRREEALFTGLRLTEGIDCAAFRARFGIDPWEAHGAAFDPLVGEGLMWRTSDGGGRFGLTRRGMLVANEILVSVV